MTETPAPLVSTPEAPVPAGAEAAFVAGAGGLPLRVALFPATVDAPRGSVIVSPGRAEPLEKYFEVVEDLRARGFAVLAHDWRGQGLSGRLLPDRLKGHAQGVDDFLTDFRAVLDAHAARLPRPWIALGHSMGGALSLLAMARGEDRLDGAVLSAPMLGLKATAGAPLAFRALAGLLGRALPTGGPGGQSADPLLETFEDKALTRDRARFERYHAQLRACPDLKLGPVTWGWLSFALQASHWLRTGREVRAVHQPVTAVLAGADRLVDNAAARMVISRLPNGRVVEAEGAWHELLIEQDEVRALVLGAVEEVAAALIGSSSSPMHGGGGPRSGTEGAC